MIRGLLLDRLTAPDPARVDQALHQFTDLLDQHVNTDLTTDTSKAVGSRRSRLT